MKRFEFTVPGEPVPKGRPRVQTKDRRGKKLAYPRVYTPTKTAQAERRIAQYALDAGVRKSLSGRISVKIEFWKASARKTDLDNLVKTVLDGLNGVAWDDDEQVCELEASKMHAGDPRTTIVMVERGAD